MCGHDASKPPMAFTSVFDIKDMVAVGLRGYV